MHLGAKYIADPVAHERRVVDFLNSIVDDAQELYLLGDVLDYWYEYKCVVPRGFVRFFGALARLADAGVKIYWFTGNHDVWLFDYLSKEIGLTVLKKPLTTSIMGKTFFLSHGDNVGHQPPLYRFMRWCFYNKVCQTLYASLHPRWTYAIAHLWSSENRTTRNPEKELRGVEQSVGYLTDFVKAHIAEHPEIDYYLFGHLHVVRDIAVEAGKRMIVLGEWIEQCTYCTFDGDRLELHTYNH